MVGKYTGLSDSYLSVLKVGLICTVIIFLYLFNDYWCLIVQFDATQKIAGPLACFS